MGPKISMPAENSPEKQQFKIKHPVFENAKLVKDKKDHATIKIQVCLDNEEEFKAWAKRVSQVPVNESLMLPISQEYIQEGFCGRAGIALITFENFPYLLSDEIINRDCLNKKLFEENQLWYLIFTLLSAAFTYHRQGNKVGDIRPDNIFINEDGQVKVACVDSWPREQTNYSKSFYEKTLTYLSPEQIKDYQFGKSQQSVDKQLAQTFSIGLTCLDAATLSLSLSLYSKNLKFSYEKLEQRLVDFKTYGYSELLILTIENMCEVDTEYRSKSQQILQWLLPYEEAIVNLQFFQVDRIPQKMQSAKDRQKQHSIHNQKTHYIESSYPQSSVLKMINANLNNLVTGFDRFPEQISSNPTLLKPNVQFSIQPTTYQGTTTYHGPTTYQGLTTYQGSTQGPIQGLITSQGPIVPNGSTINQGPSSFLISQQPEPGSHTMKNYTMMTSDVQSYPNVSLEGQKITLQQINQQLNQSKKLFPDK